MRLRREDDRLNLTADLVTDAETGKKTLTMTSQPKAGLGAEDFYGATLTLTVNGTLLGFVTFTSVVATVAPTATVIGATGLFTVAGDQTTSKASCITLTHTQSKGVVIEKALIYEIG